MSKPRRKTSFPPLHDGLFAVKQRKAIPQEFVLDALAPLSPRTRRMFGCLAVYVEDKIVATNATGRQTTGYGLLPPKSTTRVYAASFPT